MPPACAPASVHDPAAAQCEEARASTRRQHVSALSGPGAAAPARIRDRLSTPPCGGRPAGGPRARAPGRRAGRAGRRGRTPGARPPAAHAPPTPPMRPRTHPRAPVPRAPCACQRGDRRRAPGPGPPAARSRGASPAWACGVPSAISAHPPPCHPAQPRTGSATAAAASCATSAAHSGSPSSAARQARSLPGCAGRRPPPMHTLHHVTHHGPAPHRVIDRRGSVVRRERSPQRLAAQRGAADGPGRAGRRAARRAHRRPHQRVRAGRRVQQQAHLRQGCQRRAPLSKLQGHLHAACCADMGRARMTSAGMRGRRR